jgi:hypothetical protein
VLEYFERMQSLWSPWDVSEFLTTRDRMNSDIGSVADGPCPLDWHWCHRHHPHSNSVRLSPWLNGHGAGYLLTRGQVTSTAMCKQAKNNRNLCEEQGHAFTSNMTAQPSLPAALLSLHNYMQINASLNAFPEARTALSWFHWPVNQGVHRPKHARHGSHCPGHSRNM